LEKNEKVRASSQIGIDLVAIGIFYLFYSFCWIVLATLIASAVCDDLSLDQKRACAERHLKRAGTLENDFFSSYTINAIADEQCKPYIKSISQTYVDKLRENFLANPQTAPLAECIITGMMAQKATELDMAGNHFDDQHLHDKIREFKYKQELTDIVKSVLQKCAGTPVLSE
jgi:hypothetical protein